MVSWDPAAEWRSHLCWSDRFWLGNSFGKYTYIPRVQLIEPAVKFFLERVSPFEVYSKLEILRLFARNILNQEWALCHFFLDRLSYLILQI